MRRVTSDREYIELKANEKLVLEFPQTRLIGFEIVGNSFFIAASTRGCSSDDFIELKEEGFESSMISNNALLRTEAKYVRITAASAIKGYIISYSEPSNVI